MYKISFEISALAISLVGLIYVILTKRKQYRFPKGIKNKLTNQHFVFLAMLISNILSAASSVTGVYLQDLVTAGTGNMEVLKVWQYLFHMLYFLFHSSLSVSFALYILNVTGSTIGKKKSFFILFMLPYLLALLIVLTNHWTKFAFYMDENNLYHRGKLMLVLYGIGLLYIILGLFFFFRDMKAISKADSFTIGSVIIIASVGIAVQAIWSDILIELFAEAITITIMMVLLEEKRGHLDPVTGTLNRIAFVDANRRLIQTKQHYSLYMLKLTNLESYFSKLSEKEQEKILIEIARYLNLEFGDFDIYQYSNKDFAVLVRDEISKIDTLSDRILYRFSNEWHIYDLSILLDVTLILAKVPDDIKAIEELEELMVLNYKNNQGESKLLLYADILKEDNDAYYERLLRHAINNNKLSVKYQPIWSKKAGKTIACEALLRVNTEELKNVSPEVYIPVAEKTGLIRDIGLFVFEEVCKFLSLEEVMESSLEYVEINLSMYQFLYKDLVKSYEHIRKKYDIRPSRINLEITETAAALDLDNYREIVSKFKSLGYTFSLDDFGTGYSNIAGILRSDYKNIKIDKSILWSMNDNDKTRLLLESLIKFIVGSLGNVIQEGVETKEQLELVTGFGCDLIQGFYFSKPLSKDDFISYLKNE